MVNFANLVNQIQVDFTVLFSSLNNAINVTAPQIWGAKNAVFSLNKLLLTGFAGCNSSKAGARP